MADATIARHISGAGTFLIHSGAGQLVTLNINTAGTAITLYDNVAGSGSVIAAYTTATGSFDFGKIVLSKGLTIVTTGTPDITVITI